MGFLNKFINKAPPMPEHLIDGTNLLNDFTRRQLLQHWLLGGRVQMQMEDGSWENNPTPSFSPDVAYRIAGHINQFTQLQVNLTQGAELTAQKRINEHVTHNGNLQKQLNDANSKIRRLQDELNQPSTVGAMPAPTWLPDSPPVPAAVAQTEASNFTMGCLYPSTDGRQFEVVADKPAVFARFNMFYSPTTDPDKKQLVVLRQDDKKAATFACRTGSGKKNVENLPSNLDLVNDNKGCGASYVVPRLTSCGGFIVVAKRKASKAYDKHFIALRVATGEALALTDAEAA